MSKQAETVPLIPSTEPSTEPKFTDVGDGNPQKIAMGIAIVAIIFVIVAIAVFTTGNKNTGVGLMITSFVIFGIAPIVLFAGLQKQENERKLFAELQKQENERKQL